MLMEWNDKLDIGVDEMNDQHKILLDLMNRLYDGAKAQQNFDELVSTLEKLKNFTIKHFKEEEEYMEKTGFPGLNSHKIIHQQLLEKFVAEEQNILAQKSFPDSFFSFLKMWLLAHIQGIDVKYGEHKNQDVA